MSLYTPVTEVMLDLETLSLRPNAHILTIGAIKFTRKGKLKPLHEFDTFYRRITIDSCKELDMHISEETINWWNSQNKDVFHEAINNPDRIPIQTALKEFTAWFGDTRLIWANGDDFDCVVLAEAYRACGMVEPWKYFNTRDVRTVMDIAGITMNDVPKVEQAHHALHDCYRQIDAVQRSFKRIHIQ
jgi:hypothetical protein